MSRIIKKLSFFLIKKENLGKEKDMSSFYKISNLWPYQGCRNKGIGRAARPVALPLFLNNGPKWAIFPCGPVDLIGQINSGLYPMGHT